LAVFNPQVPQTQDPNYLNYARAIEAPAPNQSTKIALEGTASILGEGVSAADAIIKGGIKNAAYEKVDPLRDKYTQGLEMIKADLDKGVIPAPVQSVGGTTSGKSLLDSNASADETPDEADMPAGLGSGLDRVRQLAAAKAAGSPRLNDTQYAKDTLSVAKQLRAQYGSGYRDYIDSEVSKASGLPVANSYYQNMLLDINRQLVQMGKTKDDIGKAMMSNLDVPGMAGYIQKRNAGDATITDSFVLGKIGDWQNLQTQQKIDAAKRAEKSDLNKDDIAKQTQGMTKTLTDSVQFEMSAVKDLGIGNSSTAADLIQFFDDAAQGKHPELSDAELNQKRMLFNSWVTSVERRLSSNIAGYAPVVGADVAQTTLQKAMFPIYTMQKFVNSKEDGPAFFHAQQVEALKKDASYNFLKNKDTQGLSMQLLGARDILGEQYFPDFIRSMLTNKQDEKYKDMFNEEAMSAIKPITDQRGAPIPRYMVDAIKKGKQVGATGESGYFEAVANLPMKIADPKMPLAAKDQLIDWAFNPKNVGRLDELKMDYRDPNTGEWVPGKYRMFNLLSAPAITDGVAETAKAHPENYQKYEGTLKTEFGRLYRSDVVSLNKIMEKPYLNAHFSYNDESKSFGLVDNSGKPILRNDRALGIQQPNAVYLNGMLDILDRVNGGIRNLSYIHDKNPQKTGDTSQFLLQTLQTIGFRPGENINGATEGMMRSIIKTQAPDLPPDKVNELLLGRPGGVRPTGSSRSNLAPEDTGGDLQSFIKNPAGRQAPKVRNLSDDQLLSIDTQDIPEGMSARDFLDSLKKSRR
jgi:hypothetical protein